jgi:Transcriptional regulator
MFDAQNAWFETFGHCAGKWPVVLWFLDLQLVLRIADGGEQQFMNIDQIRQFLNLTESLNFTQAARISGVTQPTLSRSIQRLEEQLGGRLLFRDGKDTRLTALGMAVETEFQQILKSEEKVRQMARANRHGALEKLTLGIVSSIAPKRLSELITSAMGMLSSSEVILHPINQTNGIELVLSGTLDGCFVGKEPDAHHKLSSIKLFEERLLLACGRGHRLARMDRIPIGELAQETYIDRLNCEFREQVLEILTDRMSVPLPRLRSEREDWLQDVVGHGAGVTFLPEHSVISQELTLRPVDGIELSRNIYFVSVSGSGTSMVLQGFRKLLLEANWMQAESGL